MKLFIALVVSMLITSSAFAKRFASKYCEFELPPGWECALEGSEYVCQSENADRKKNPSSFSLLKFVESRITSMNIRPI